MRKLVVLLCFTLALTGCSKVDKFDLDGHWYLTAISPDIHSMYLEFKIDGNKLNIKRDGDHWYEAPFDQYANNKIQIQDFKGKVDLNNHNRLVISDSLLNEYIFQRVNKLHPLDENEISKIRKLQYYARHTSIKDSLKVEALKLDMWVFFGGDFDQREEEAIKIERPK